MNFLVTNDDGIHSPGIEALFDACTSLGNVVMVAPLNEQSGVGHQLTVNRPISFKALGPRNYSVTGSPADCVRIALTCLEFDIDWVISGINYGANFGVDLYTSGTVAAAREAAILGYPALAISQYYSNGSPINWEISSKWTRMSISRLVQHKLSSLQFWNLNIPCTSVEKLRSEPQLIYCPPDPTGYHFSVEGGSSHATLRTNIHDRPRRPAHDIAMCLSGHITASNVSL